MNPEQSTKEIEAALEHTRNELRDARNTHQQTMIAYRVRMDNMVSLLYSVLPHLEGLQYARQMPVYALIAEIKSTIRAASFSDLNSLRVDGS